MIVGTQKIARLQAYTAMSCSSISDEMSFAIQRRIQPDIDIIFTASEARSTMGKWSYM